METKTCYVTTPIYYSSGRVHIGNSYSTLVCDVYARYNRLKGNDTFFLTGMDEHGQKVEQAAKQNNQTPQEFVDLMAEQTKEVWELLKITNDEFIRTSESRHIATIQKIFEKLLANDDIYLGEYEGHYCVPCESFIIESRLNEDGSCPDCNRPTELIREETYFLRLKKYEQQLLEYIEANPNFIKPSTRRNEVVAFIKQGLEDLSVSRTTFKWGVPVKSNPKHVVYVWIDALSNYISALGYASSNDELFKKYWLDGTNIVHVVGKDILRFHAIYWPIMLLALDIPIKFSLYAHGWWLMQEGKMAKSRGNVVYPADVVGRYGLDATRLFLIKEMPYANDSVFTYDRFIEKFNADLANDLGNLVSRTISMVNKYFAGTVTKPNKNYTEFDDDLQKTANNVIKDYIKYFDELQFQNGLQEVWSLISRANKYVDETTPWLLARDESKKDELNNVLYNLVESLRLITIMISPVIVDASETIFTDLGITKQQQTFASLKFGKISKTTVTKNPSILFKRLDMKEEVAFHEQQTPGITFKDEITFDDFAKLDLRIGTVLTAKRDKKSDRLLILEVDIAGETRQIVSGIAHIYAPQDLIGKNIVVLVNLKPAKIRGNLSEGMLLAASDKNNLEVLFVDKVNNEGTVD